MYKIYLQFDDYKGWSIIKFSGAKEEVMEDVKVDSKVVKLLEKPLKDSVSFQFYTDSKGIKKFKLVLRKNKECQLTFVGPCDGLGISDLISKVEEVVPNEKQLALF